MFFFLNCSGLGTEVVRLCLECIIPICSHTFKENLQQTEFGFCLKTLFKTFFEMIFSSSMEMELFDVCSSVLYSFICCFHVSVSDIYIFFFLLLWKLLYFIWFLNINLIKYKIKKNQFYTFVVFFWLFNFKLNNNRKHIRF